LVGKLSLVQKVVLLSLAAIVPTGIVLGLILSRQIETSALANARRETALLGQGLVAPLLTERDLGGLNPGRYDELDRLVRDRVLPYGIVQVKVWNRDGMVIYSNDPETVGKTYPIAEDLEEALHGEVASEIEELDEAEHEGLEGLDKALEVYAPIRFEGRIEGAFELYRAYGPIAATIRSDQQRLYLALAVGLALLVVLLGRIVRRASRALVAQSDELSTLYGRERENLTRLQELDELKTDIVAAVSHELRTPLTSIRGALGTLLETSESLDPTDTRELLEIGIRNSDRLNTLVGELLEVPRLDIGDRKVAIERLKLDGFLAGVLEGHGERVRLEMPSALPDVHTDRAAVGKILGLLLDNAAKFSPEGSPITVRVAAGAQELRISVEDEGPGIPPGEERRIFEPFYQVDRGSSRAAGGIGLGLHLANKLAAMVGGTLTVATGRERGASFELSLPLPAMLVDGALQGRMPSSSSESRSSAGSR
jgi:signal transduction histidine kinase